jgi:ATP synthase protein I
MPEPETSSSETDFESRLRRARAHEDDTSGRAALRRGPKGNFGLGMRVGVELLAGVAVGVGIGMALDAWLKTAPLFMMLLLLLGGVAGVMNVHRVLRGLDQTVGLGRAQQRAERPRDQ